MRLMIIFINKTSIKLLRSSNTILIKIPKRLKPISIIGLMIQPLEEFKLKLTPLNTPTPAATRLRNSS